MLLVIQAFRRTGSPLLNFHEYLTNNTCSMLLTVSLIISFRIKFIISTVYSSVFVGLNRNEAFHFVENKSENNCVNIFEWIRSKIIFILIKLITGVVLNQIYSKKLHEKRKCVGCISHKNENFMAFNCNKQIKFYGALPA